LGDRKSFQTDDDRLWHGGGWRFTATCEGKESQEQEATVQRRHEE
jgi:hypothetical protein